MDMAEAQRLPTAPLLSRNGCVALAPGQRVALVTGANRGIGLEVARQLARHGVFPVLGTRNPDRGTAAVDCLHAQGLKAAAVRLDVTSDADVADSIDLVLSRLGRLDILINNAGVFLEPRQARVSAADSLSGRDMLDMFDTNVVGAYRLAAAAIPVMLRQGDGRIINVSSDMGRHSALDAELAAQGGFCVGYRMSKMALNTMTRVLAAEVQDTAVRVNAVTPGKVQTAMGRADADRSVSQGADSIVWLATLAQGCPNGALVRDRQVVAW